MRLYLRFRSRTHYNSHDIISCSLRIGETSLKITLVVRRCCTYPALIYAGPQRLMHLFITILPPSPLRDCVLPAYCHYVAISTVPLLADDLLGYLGFGG
jgi:hypothetical protein